MQKSGRMKTGALRSNRKKKAPRSNRETLEEIIVEGISAGETEIRIPDEAYKAPAVRADDAKS